MTPSNIDTEMEESGEFLPAQEQQIEQQIYDQDLKTAKQTWKKRSLFKTLSENFEKDEKLSHPPLFSLHRHIRTEENKHIYEHKTHRFIKKTRKEREVSLDEMMRSDENKMVGGVVWKRTDRKSGWY